MATIPPDDLLDLVHNLLGRVLSENPAATWSEAFLQNLLEFELLTHSGDPRYYIRIGINYHGAKVQQIALDDKGKMIGWNPAGDALATGKKAKILLAGYTIFDRDPDEPMMNDTKIGGGAIPEKRYVRVELKVRGWLGKTKNLDGKQMEKDLDLLKNDNADLLIMCLSETAHKKWRGEGPGHQALRRTGTNRFIHILADFNQLETHGPQDHVVVFEGQRWRIRAQLVKGLATSIMPGAAHVITTCSIAP